MTEQEIYDDIINALTKKGGYILLPESKRPTVTIEEDGVEKGITIKSAVWVCEYKEETSNESHCEIKLIDTNDELWDMQDYLSSTQMLTLHRALVPTHEYQIKKMEFRYETIKAIVAKVGKYPCHKVSLDTEDSTKFREVAYSRFENGYIVTFRFNDTHEYLDKLTTDDLAELADVVTNLLDY